MVNHSNLNRSILIFFLVIPFAFFSSDKAYAWSKAIWPFNTPYMVSKQICKNSKTWAKAAYYASDQTMRADLLSELKENKAFSIRDDPKYSKWNELYYSEMARYIRIVWANPSITEDMAIEIVENDCNSRRELIKKRLEDTEP